MNKYIKHSIDLKKDCGSYVMLKATSVFNNGTKEILSDGELIDSYISSILCLSTFIKSKLDSNVYILDSNMPAVPYMFLCRHTIELIIKKKLELLNIRVKGIHNIKQLWNNLYENINYDLSYYNDLIDAFNEIDEDGQKFRYSKDTSGNYFQNKPIFMHPTNIYNDILSLKKILLEKNN